MEKGGASPAPGLPSVLGHGSVPRPPLPQAQGRAVTTRGAGWRGVGRSMPPPVVVAAARAGGGTPLTAGLREARLSVAGRSVTRGRGLCSCRRPQVRAPLSPRCVRGERFSFSPGVGPPSPLTLCMCSNVARGVSSRGPSPLDLRY
ncbi:hypothetical protein NDU88_003451 [Pleurodeles waltl]|uniref:Uncharacterized protein n=1 Tax=Pleurodeles waltl TaxID=8319 RepID=A0AAV7KVL4_PLEWA|nr:hypothetical protein NDU88_003451 [Pleurodeles waltl]